MKWAAHISNKPTNKKTNKHTKRNKNKSDQYLELDPEANWQSLHVKILFKHPSASYFLFCIISYAPVIHVIKPLAT